MDKFVLAAKIAHESGMTQKQVRTFLNLLIKDKMVVRIKGSKWTRLRICNYDTYQNGGQDEGLLNDHRRAGSGRGKGKQKTTNNKRNNVNNENNQSIVDSGTLWVYLSNLILAILLIESSLMDLLVLELI